MSLRDERDMKKTRKIVVERESLIEVIQEKNSAIQYYMANLKTAKLVISVLRSDSKLIELFHSYLDDILIFVRNVESSLKQENNESNKEVAEIKTVNLKINVTSTNSVLVSFGNYNINSKEKFYKESVSYITTAFASNKNTFKNFSRFVCSFTKWEDFVKEIKLRISYSFDDLKQLTEVEQERQSVNSKLETLFY